jgi:hypothetical protein
LQVHDIEVSVELREERGAIVEKNGEEKRRGSG